MDPGKGGRPRAQVRVFALRRPRRKGAPMRKTRWVVAVAGLAVLVVVAAACGSSKKATTAGTTPTTGTTSQWTTSNPFKAAFIYVGAPSDAGWTHAHDVGRLAVESNFNGVVKTEFKENVAEGPQVAQVIQQLINDGNKIIFATSFGYQDAMAAAAKANPNVLFEQATGTDLAANLSAEALSKRAVEAGSPSLGRAAVARFPFDPRLRVVRDWLEGKEREGK